MPANSKEAIRLTALIRERETSAFYNTEKNRPTIKTAESRVLREQYTTLRTSMPTKGPKYLERLDALEALRDQILAQEGFIAKVGQKGHQGEIAKDTGILQGVGESKGVPA